MSEIDKQIHDALNAEEGELIDDDEDWQTHFESIKVLFRGRTRWLTILHLSVMAFFCTMIVVSAVQFFRVEGTRAMIAWATVAIAFVVAQANSELYFIMEWNKYVFRRDVKQLELRVASLVSALRDDR